MSDLRELYQEVILDHHKKPRNFRKQENARHIEGFNPLCGDEVVLYLDVDDDEHPIQIRVQLNTASSNAAMHAVNP